VDPTFRNFGRHWCCKPRCQWPLTPNRGLRFGSCQWTLTELEAFNFEVSSLVSRKKCIRRLVVRNRTILLAVLTGRLPVAAVATDNLNMNGLCTRTLRLGRRSAVPKRRVLSESADFGLIECHSDSDFRVG
jgi:hypothetical protein